MALRNIVKVGDPVLTKKCRPVTKFDDNLATLLDDMFETMHDANGVGLAGPQVGILRRVVVVDTGEEDLELVNPEIVEVSEETQTGVEGCLSLPGKWGIVTRPMHAVVRAQDRCGDWYEYEGEELKRTAIVPVTFNEPGEKTVLLPGGWTKTTANTFRAFFWNSLEDIRPLCGNDAR